MTNRKLIGYQTLFFAFLPFVYLAYIPVIKKNKVSDASNRC